MWLGFKEFQRKLNSSCRLKENILSQLLLQSTHKIELQMNSPGKQIAMRSRLFPPFGKSWGTYFENKFFIK